MLSPAISSGDVEGRCVVIVDDLIASGTTILHAAQAGLARGAKKWLRLQPMRILPGAPPRFLRNRRLPASLSRIAYRRPPPPEAPCREVDGLFSRAALGRADLPVAR
nr:phosphoribosyltransferase family protein [Rhizobium laguerreae]